MPSTKKTHSTQADTTEAVVTFVAALDHPLKNEILLARKTILDASPLISEGVKWNAPSFRTTEYFATTHLRCTDQVQFVFHLGAKVRTDGVTVEIADPSGLARWLAKDRCLVSLGKGETFEAKQAALADFVRSWIRHV